MGIYGEYLNLLQSGGIEGIHQERKHQLTRIRDLRGNDVIVIASDMSGRPEKARAPIMIDYSDKVPIADQLDALHRDNVDVILETPGGRAESAEDIVRTLRNHFPGRLSFVIPGAAMSAGTIMAMAGDDILMEPDSSLGPIDAQVFMNGKTVSAEACLTGLRKIMDEVGQTGRLNPAYIPILQNISPGEIQAWQNAQDFSYELVWKWLAMGKFRLWNTHNSTGAPVTTEEKEKRAKEIADSLRNHSKWLTHGRSIKMADLREMRLKITDYSQELDLCDAIRRYYTLLRMTFDTTTMYKLVETPETQIYRFVTIQAPPLQQRVQVPTSVNIDLDCNNCGQKTQMQANLQPGVDIEPSRVPFPADNKFTCPNCGVESDLSTLRAQIESQTKKRIV